MKILAIIEATIREGLAKKTILGMFIVSTLLIVIAIFLFQSDAVQQHLLAPANKHVHAGQNADTPNLMGLTVLDFVWTVITGFLLLLSVFVGTFVTTGFVTSIMEKGTIDLLLSKPVPRWQYIVGRYLGSVLIIAVEVAYMVIGLWFVAGVSIGSWSGGFLASIPLVTLAFSTVFALVTLIGVLTRSSWFALIIGLVLYLIGSVALPIFVFVSRLLTGDEATGVLGFVGKVFHYALPQSNDLGATMTKVILERPTGFSSVLIALVLIGCYLGLATWAFAKKEF